MWFWLFYHHVTDSSHVSPTKGSLADSELSLSAICDLLGDTAFLVGNRVGR